MCALADLFPNTRAEILRLLFGDDRKEAHLRDLARHASLSPAAIQRELSSLTALDLVIPRRDGNRLYFSANTAHPLYPEIRAIVLKTSGIVPTLQNALASLAGVDLAFIFGSVASGSLRSSSDVDLLVIGTTGLRQISAALSGISGSLNREINPSCLTPAEWSDKLRRNDAFALRVSAEPKLWLKGGPDALAAMGG
jgi:predicted nucleotidyltransferase